MNNWIDDIEWDDLLEEIRYEKCVLVIGPDLISFNDIDTLFQKLTQELSQDSKLREYVDIQPDYIFEHEELLQLQPGKRDTSLFRFYREFYQRQTEFDAPFAKIAQMPFHAIISLLPDNRLRETFGKMNRAHEFGYYAPFDTPQEIVKPTQSIPLIYNMMGTLDPPNTVLTFDHLFNYLQGILGARPLPVQLDKTLKEAKTFLFLGVHFEKWYMQVMLRVFLPRESLNGKISKFSLLKHGQRNDVRTFIARRLQLDFKTIEPLDFLNELYERLKMEKMLINPPKPTRATVFLSYSHADSEQAQQLATALQKANIEVIMDMAAMPPGEKIRRFMTRVLEVDALVALISEHSLRSPWVGTEVMDSIRNSVRLVPCYLDKQFLDPTVVDTWQQGVWSKLHEFDRLINERRQKNPLDKVSDLTEEADLWREFGQNLPDLIAEIKGRKAISLLPGDWDVGIQQIIDTIVPKS